MKTKSWIQDFIPDLLDRKISLEEVRRIREREVGHPIKLKTIARAINTMGYSVAGMVRDICVSEMPKTEPMFSGNSVCRDCRFWKAGICITPKQTTAGWLDRFDEGFCPLKETV